MKVVIDFAFDASIIEFIPFLGNDMEKYLEEFEKWYYDVDEMGCYDKKKCHAHYKYFNVDVIIDWIKEVAPESNPKILIRNIKPEDVDPSLPGLYF